MVIHFGKQADEHPRVMMLLLSVSWCGGRMARSARTRYMSATNAGGGTKAWKGGKKDEY